MSIAGYELSLSKQKGQAPESKERVRIGTEELKAYKQGKEHLEQKIIENEKWYKSKHWDIIRNKRIENGEPEPVTAYLFNTIANKHADFMDNYPEASMLPRTQGDEQEAEKLSSIVPVQLENNNFEQVYSDVSWYKLKQGTGVYGIFYNPDSNDGLGGTDIVKLDLLNVFWKAGVTNIQKSPRIFVVTLVDNDILKQQYQGILPSEFAGSKIINVKEYALDDSIDTTKSSVVVDMYEKVIIDSKEVVHLTKFVDQYELESTWNDEYYAQTGLYEHGRYPIEFDVLFPEEGMPIGFGYIDVVKNPQMYIDKLDSIITKNALIAGKQRFAVKEGAVNEDELLDMGTDVIHANTSLTDDNFRIIQGNPLHPFIVDHRREKKEELKEVSGVNEFSRGEGGKGITAASAIAMLQEAGNKLSRDMIKGSYNTFSRIVYQVIEHIRQFHDETREYRIDTVEGQYEFQQYNNEGLKPQTLPPAYEGQEPQYRKAMFDIKVKAQKQSPYSTLANNEMAKEMYEMGFFNPQMADQAIQALEMMTFEGKETIKQNIQKNMQMQSVILQQQQQIQQLVQLVQGMTGQEPQQQAPQMAGQGGM